MLSKEFCLYVRISIEFVKIVLYPGSKFKGIFINWRMQPSLTETNASFRYYGE